jgi:hypothetical protein
MTERLAEIKRLYFQATRSTIERDVDRAIDLLKEMASEDERERATVYMAGLAQMRSEWRLPKTEDKRHKGKRRQ